MFKHSHPRGEGGRISQREMPTFIATVATVACCFIAGLHGPARSAVTRIPAETVGLSVNLQALIDRAQNGDTLLLGEGVFKAFPRRMVDSLCGNCEEHATRVEATVGFVIRGKGLVIIGSGRSTVLSTNAGYGVYFDGSEGSVLQNLSITGGLRDPDGRATDAAVVARRSRVTVKGCALVNNSARVDTVVVGIGGICGREGSELFILGNEIAQNGWDGVALYRGATACIVDNVISEGRGAGIGITWDATAVVLRNRISGYWKGIGAFGASRAIVRGNAVLDNLGWGIVATGSSWCDASNNVVYHNGNCGMAVWSDTCTARFTNNIVARNGWRKEWVCPCVGVWENGKNERAEFSYNDVWGNQGGGYAGLGDLTGVDGNVSLDPGFAGGDDFRLPSDSPLVDAGNPSITDTDGSPSDIGLGR
jgi:parallel beta-helix repeat protein